MRYYSTNRLSSPVSFKEAMLHSEAPDGGLYMPEKLPVLPKALIKNLAGMTMSDISFIITNSLFTGDLPSNRVKKISDDVCSMHVPLVRISPDVFVLELFHGPTMTVKDWGAQMLKHIFCSLNNPCVNDLNVLVATNGNSGNAIADAFKGIPGVNVYILYPRDIPSDHVAHARSIGENIHAIAVNGSIDECRALINAAFEDEEMNSRMMLTSANSMNIGSLLPYTIMYFHALSALLKQVENPSDVFFSVPTGNCGNLLAGHIAQLMGLPVKHIIGACNSNAAFHRFLTAEDGCQSAAVGTLAYGMDTVATINRQRFLSLCHNDMNLLRRYLMSSTCTDSDIRDTIRRVYDESGYILDPHAAVAYKGLMDHKPAGATGVVFATASPFRSQSLIKEITGHSFEPVRPSKCLINKAWGNTRIAPTLPAFKKYLRDNTLPASFLCRS